MDYKTIDAEILENVIENETAENETVYAKFYNQLKKRGYSQQKIKTNADFIIDILDIISDCDEALKIAMEMCKKKQKAASEKEHEYNKLWNKTEQERSNLYIREKRCEIREKDIETAQINLRSLKECETSEARDKVRLMNEFLTLVDVENMNGYQETEYIKALGGILSANNKTGDD